MPPPRLLEASCRGAIQRAVLALLERLQLQREPGRIDLELPLVRG